MDLTQKLGELPLVLEPILNKISLVPEITHAEEPTLPFDQLTVSLYIVFDGHIYEYLRLSWIPYLSKPLSLSVLFQ